MVCEKSFKGESCVPESKKLKGSKFGATIFLRGWRD